MIIDFHTHIFPPEVRENRDRYVGIDAAFAEMYNDSKAKMAVAEELLANMEKAGVDVSVAMGFAWRDQELCQMHNDYILEAAARSNGRLVPFCMVNPRAGTAAEQEVERCAAAGARGLGELRPENQGYDLAQSEAGDLLAALAREHEQILLFHVTEPEGHIYPGKRGLALATFRRFVAEHKDIPVVGGHFAGGLPLHQDSATSDLPNTYLDTAAMPYLYDERIIPPSLALLPGRVLLGSDWPLIGQKRQIKLLRSIVDEGPADAIMGGSGRTAARSVITSAHQKEPRLFVAIPLSREVHSALSDVQSKLRRHLGEGPRWVRPDGSHLTIKFLGNTPHDRIEQVKEVISSACRGKSPFTMSTTQLGSFGSPHRPTVVWLGLNGDMAPLRDLHKQLEERMEGLGWPKESRRFSPHLTVARMPKRISGGLSSRLPIAISEVRMPSVSMRVTHIKLMRSVLQPDGAQYSDVATFPLTDGLAVE